jgi:hypothetical protein
MTHSGENRNAYKVWIGKIDRNRHLEELGIDGLILKGTLEKYHRVPWTGYILHWIGANGRLLQTQYQPSGSMKCCVCLNQLIN